MARDAPQKQLPADVHRRRIGEDNRKKMKSSAMAQKNMGDMRKSSTPFWDILRTLLMILIFTSMIGMTVYALFLYIGLAPSPVEIGLMLRETIDKLATDFIPSDEIDVELKPNLAEAAAKGKL